jgi:FkbM family methyltransferase
LRDIAGDVRKLSFDLRSRFLPATDITCETKNGLMTFSSKDRSVGRRLFSRREWSWDLMSAIQALLREEELLKPTGNDLLINVGANIGSVLISLMRTGSFRYGVGFEPGPDNAAYLRKNVTQNGLDDAVATFQIGLSDENTTAEFELAAHNMGDHRVRGGSAPLSQPSSFDESEREVIEVQLRTLDDVLAEHDYAGRTAALVWVDIQGHEGHFLKGARNTLAGRVPLVIELWPYGINRAGMDAKEFCALVIELCSDFYSLGDGGWQKQSTSDFRALYDRYEGSTDGTDIVLVTR